jgi:hypothetical protein
MQKFAMPFPRYWPPLFCLISAEAYLPGKSATGSLQINYKSKRVKADRKPGREYGPQRRRFFLS